MSFHPLHAESCICTQCFPMDSASAAERDRAELASELRSLRLRLAQAVAEIDALKVQGPGIRNAALEEAALAADAAATDAAERSARWGNRGSPVMAQAKDQEARGLTEASASIRALKRGGG